MALIGFTEHRRLQDWYNPGSMGKQYLLGLEKYLGGSGDPAYPGGPIFNALGFGTKSEKEMKELKLKEIKNGGRLAMLAFLGMSIQAIFTGVAPSAPIQSSLCRRSAPPRPSARAPLPPSARAPPPPGSAPPLTNVTSVLEKSGKYKTFFTLPRT